MDFFYRIFLNIVLEKMKSLNGFEILAIIIDDGFQYDYNSCKAKQRVMVEHYIHVILGN